MKILGVCGSLQRKSANLSLLHAAVLAAPAGVEVEIFEGLSELPHMNPDLEASGEAPEAVLAWRDALSGCDAVLVASPEIGHSLPGFLKNAIDWVIASGELHGKIVAVTCSTRDPERGRRGLAALRQVLEAVEARIVGGQPLLRGPTLEAQVAALLQATVAEVLRPDR